MKKFYLFFIVVLCTVTGNAQTADSAYQDGVASFKVRVDSSTEFPPYPYEGIYPVMDSLITKYGITSITKQFPASENPHLAGMYFVKFDSIYAANLLIADLQQYTFMEFACKMPINKPFSTPNDTKHSFQWALKKIMTDSIWHLLPGDGKRIKIAVIDDAILLSHEDLKGVIDTNYTELLGVSTVDDDYNGRFLTIDDSIGYDIADQDNNVNPPGTATDIYFSHGTHVAGIAAGVTNNGKGIASLNYNGNIKIIPIKVASDADPLSFIRTNDAMFYAINMGAKVINMSYGGAHSSADSMLIANHPNVIFVAAAGNSGVEEYNYPASYNLPNIISVGATNEYDRKAVFSTYNDRIDIMAPGVGIIGAVASDTNAYNNYGGTSMAAPLVAGLCALLWSYDSMLTTQEVIDRVINTAENIDFENPHFAGKIGAGRINAYRAFNNITSQPHQAGFKVNKIDLIVA